MSDCILVYTIQPARHQAYGTDGLVMREPPSIPAPNFLPTLPNWCLTTHIHLTSTTTEPPMIQYPWPDAEPPKRHTRTEAEILASRAAWQKEYRAKVPLTPEQKARKRARDKAREQSPDGKAKLAERYRRKLESREGHTPRPEFCEICGSAPNPGRALCADHDHKTGAFRGWICQRCNYQLGHVGDDATKLRKMADYLDRAASHA